MASNAGPAPAGASLRLAEVLVPLSLVTDLGMGLPDEQAMRSCLLATALARERGLPEAEVAHVYFATLLQHLGCTATAREEASHVAGDQLSMRRVVSRTDEGRPSELLAVFAQVGRGAGPLGRGQALLGLIAGFRWGPPVQSAVCEVATRLAGRLGMPVQVRTALGQMFERWDGKGHPGSIGGEGISAATRYAHVASRAVGMYAIGGIEAAIDGVRASGGGWLDPAIASAFLDRGPALLAEIAASDALPATLDAEPLPHVEVSRQRLDEVAGAFGDMVDLLSPYTLGHASGVAAIADGAAQALRLPMSECIALRRAALLHDLGRVGVPAGVWDKGGALSAAEWEHVRLHAYYTERILARAPLLGVEASIAGMHHERIDGSGYHRGSSGPEQPQAARILAAADAYHAMTEPRAHRAALSPESAADELVAAAQAGRLDAEAVQAVLAAAGECRPVPQASPPAGLSEREVEVLRLVAAGCSNPEIARRLVVSRRTAEHHVQHIYAKIGVSTRPGATLFALEQGILPQRATSAPGRSAANR
ncbi:MAG: HD domain-containing phosphohydrolase [Dehalococcoidia bacterium]